MNTERWQSLFKTAGIDIEDIESYRIVVSHGPMVIPSGHEQNLLVLTPEQFENWDNSKPWLSKTLDSTT